MTRAKHHVKQRGVWGPYVLAAITILLSGYPALILFAINFGRFGPPKKRIFWLIITPVIYILMYAMDQISPDWSAQRGLLFNITTIWIIYAQQIGLYQRWKRDQKPIAPIWLAVLISLGVIGLLYGLDSAAWYLLP